MHCNRHHLQGTRTQFQEIPPLVFNIICSKSFYLFPSDLMTPVRGPATVVSLLRGLNRFLAEVGRSATVRPFSQHRKSRVRHKLESGKRVAASPAEPILFHPERTSRQMIPSTLPSPACSSHNHNAGISGSGKRPSGVRVLCCERRCSATEASRNGWSQRRETTRRYV